MKIDGFYTKVERVSIDVAPWDVFNSLQRTAYEAAGINVDSAYIKDGKIVHEEENFAGAGHKWYVERVVINLPSPEQLAVIEQFDAMRKLLVKLNVNKA